MSSIYGNKGPENMYDNDRFTMAHTEGDHADNIITVDLFIQKMIHSVIFMNRQYDPTPWNLMRLNNTKVALINTNDEAIICGYTVVVKKVASEIIQVRCQDTSFATKQILITVDPSKHSLNIAELRFCFIPDSLGKLEVIQVRGIKSCYLLVS